MCRIRLFPLLFQNGCSQKLSFCDRWSRGTKLCKRDCERTTKLAFTLSYATFVATMSTRRILSCKTKSSTRTVCKYIQRHCSNFRRLFYLTFARLDCEGKCNFSMIVDKLRMFPYVGVFSGLKLRPLTGKKI